MSYPIHKFKTKNLDSDSWFDIEYHYFDDHLDEEISYNFNDPNNKLLRVQRIQLHPTLKQRRKLLSWIRLTRWIYNYAVGYAQSGKCKSFLTNKIDFRNEVRTKLPSIMQSQIKKHQLPQRLMVEAIMDVSKAYKSAFANKSAENIKRFRIRHKRCSKNRQGFVVTEDSFSKKINALFPRTLGVMKSSKDFPKIPRDSRLVHEHGKFWLYVPQPRQYKKVVGRKEECALDPGLRTFQTLYDKTNTMKICNNAYPKIRKYLDKIHKTKHRSRDPKIKKYHRRLYDKIIHCVDDLHWKTALFLVRNYDNILIGNFSTKGVVSTNGNLYKKCKDPLILLSHYKFRQRLSSKAEEYRANVYEINEAYTSKTCGGCEVVHRYLGSNKVFKCPECNWRWDRDFNGARNIMKNHHNDFHYIKNY